MANHSTFRRGFMGLVFGLAVWSAPSQVFGACTWYGANWQYRKKITIDNTEVPGTLTDFPVLISLTDTDLRDDAQNDADDILFTSSDGTTKLDHEIEDFDGATGVLVAWVKVPSVSSSSDTVVYMYYGYGSATNQENATGVWSNDYEAVYHLHDDFLDSTSNGRDGTNSGSLDAASKVADGQDFVPVDEIDLGTWSTPAVAGLTLQAWANFDDFDQDDPRLVTKAKDPATTQDHVYMLGLGGTSEKHVRFRVKTGTSDTTGSTELVANSDPATVSTWHLIAGTYDGTRMRLFKDGTEVRSTTKTGNVRQNSWDVLIGNHPGNTDPTDRAMDGQIDEVRISSSARSSNWLTAEYNNQSDPSNFYTVGSVETQETTWSGASDTDWFDATNWSGGVPDSGCDARIPSGLSNYPLLDASGAVVRDLAIESGGSINVASYTITVSGDYDNDGTSTISTGLIDVAGSFDASGGSVTFTGAGRLQLGDSVTSLGTLTESTGTIEYDDTSADRTVLAETYYNLEIDTSSRVALTGGNVTVTNDLTVSSGEFEVDDDDTLRVDGDVSVTGILDIESGSTLELSGSTTLTVNSGGEFEASGGPGFFDPLALITSSDTATPGRYTFTIAAGGVLDVSLAYFRYMDSNGIQVTDNGSVQALTRFDDVFLDNGATGGRLLKVTNNDDTVSLDNVQFFDTNGDLTYNVETVSSTSAITIDPYDGSGFGGAANENDNGGGTVTPGQIIWGVTTPVLLKDFEAIAVPGGVLLEWETKSEWNVRGFALDRARLGTSRFSRVGTTVPAKGQAPDGHKYRVLDTGAVAGVPYVYRLLEYGPVGASRLVAKAKSTLPSGGIPPTTGVTRSDPGPRAPTLLTAPHAVRRQSAAAAAAAAAMSASAHSSLVAVGNRVKVWVDGSKPEVVRVSHAALAAVGFPVDVPPSRYQVRRDDTLVPVHVLGGTDKSFEAGSAIHFVTLPFTSSESPYDVYWIELTDDVSGPPPRMIEVAGAPTSQPRLTRTIHRVEWEANEFYSPSIVDGAGRDHWFWEVLASPSAVTIDVEIDAVVSDAFAVLEVSLEAWTDDLLASPDHLTRVSLNGFLVGELLSNGRGPYGGSFVVPVGVLVEGQNSVTLQQESLADPDVVFLDRMALSYVRRGVAVDDHLEVAINPGATARLDGFSRPEIFLYRIDDSGPPARVLEAEVLAMPGGTWSLAFDPVGHSIERYQAFTPSAVREPIAVLPVMDPRSIDSGPSVDGIILVPAAWMNELEPWIAQRRAEGLTLRVVPVESVFENFDGGRPTSAAIRSFLEHTQRTWPAPAPQYVVLVGDGTYDPLGHGGVPSRQIIPVPLIESSSFETASDDWFVDFDDNGAPDLAIGRLPVATRSECRQVVQALVEYGGRRQNARNMVLIADRGEEFVELNDQLSARIPSGIGRVSLELGAIGRDLLRDVLFSSWQADPWLVHYAGHGSRTQWSAEAVLDVADGATVALGSRPPIVVALNCLNAFFHHPSSPALGERLVTDGGAIAYWGPTAVTSNIRQQALAVQFYKALTSGTANTLGEAILQAKTQLQGDPAVRAVIETWVLLGDPTLPLN